MRKRIQRFNLLVIIDLLCVMVITYAWTITACPSMPDIGACRDYPAGCGFWCYVASYPNRTYDCCCPATCSQHFTNACCEADCDLYDCFDIITGGPCPEYPDGDIYFIAHQFLCSKGCNHKSGGDPMEGKCK